MPQTVRKTSAKKISVKIKPTKVKKAKKKKSGTATDALNTYKSVKQKIFGTKESRQAKRAARKQKSVIGDDFVLPRLSGRIVTEKYAPERVTQSSNEINESPNIYVSNDEPDAGSFLAQVKDLGEVIVSSKKKKGYGIYIVIAIALIAIYLLMNKKK